MDPQPEPVRLDAGRAVALAMLVFLCLPFWTFVGGTVADALEWRGELSTVITVAALLGCITAFVVHRTCRSTAGPLLGALLLSVGSILLVPHMIHRGPDSATRCKSTVKNIGTALEMYSTDYDGSYPDSLAKLTPAYLKTIPSCAAAGAVTYQAALAEQYTVVCAGHHHRASGLPPNFPQYTSLQGLRER